MRMVSFAEPKIAIAEFRAKDKKENPLITIYVEHKNGGYYYTADNGNTGTRYTTIEEAKEDIQYLYGKWADYKLLGEEE